MNEKFKYLIADTSAFIHNKSLQEIAENVITVPDVINEVKNRRQVRRLVTLPFDLKVEEPYPENVKFVIEFAKKTGDYLSLSSIDIKVIALAYQYEKQHVGSDHLKNEPIKSVTIYSKEKPVELLNNTKLVGFYNPENTEDEESIESNDNSVEKNETEEQQIESDFTEELCKLYISERNDQENDILVSKNDESNEETNEESVSDDNESVEDGDDDDDDGWITPGNIKKVTQKYGLNIDEVTNKSPIACMSTDYAVQNVLKQIGLNVASFDGMIIKDMRTYILRCYACFKTTTIMTKQFCPKCGNKTLKRVAVSLDENGKQIIHINLRRPLTHKGKNQSLPRPKGGKHSCNPILFEDQPIPKQMPTRVARTKTNALEEDYIAGYSPFVARDIDSKSAILRGKSNIKQLMLNNAYENNRRYMKK